MKMAQVLTSERHSGKKASKRSPFEIRMDVLTVVTEGCTKPTQIMYRSNTSWLMLQKILEALMASGLLKHHVERSRAEYVATDKGFDVARHYLDLVHATKAEPTSVF
jgi:predicted transcriptional regulator